MHGEKVTIYDDKLHFRDTGVVFTLKGDALSMIIDYDFNKIDAPNAKRIVYFLDELFFGIHAEGKNSRDKNLIKSNIIKELYLHLG